MQTIQFNGIVRATSPQLNAEGNCEEILNMRQEQGAWKVVGKKKLILPDVIYEQVFVHQYSDFENYIGVKDGKVIWFASLENGKVVQKNKEICEVSGKVVLKQINNVLLIRDDSTIVKSVFGEGGYESVINELPDIATVKLEYLPKDAPFNTSYTKLTYDRSKSEEVQKAKEVIAGLINKEKSDTHYAEGRVLMCTTYGLFDGTETKPSAPQCIELGKFIKGVVRSKVSIGNNTTVSAEIKVSDLILQKLSISHLADPRSLYKDIVKKVNVYITPAYSFYDMNNINPDFIIPETIEAGDTNDAVREKELTKNEVEKMLFYKVASFNFDETDAVDVDFGALTTNETLPVDTSGWLNITGDMFVYNNRLHLYNVKRSFVESALLGNAYSTRGQQDSDPRDMSAFVYLKTDKKTLVLRYDFVGAWADKDTGGTTIRFPKVISYPDSRAEKIVFYDRNFACTPFAVSLNASATYNMACGIIKDTMVNLAWTSQPAQLPQVKNGFPDPLNLIVSESNNPYYFPPQQSYLMPGEVINLALSTEQISTSQIGMYPLYVFTTQGIYALQVGDGSVLYSNTIPISAEVALRGSNVLQTKYGIVFVTDSGLKMISGREIIDLSEALLGDPDIYMKYSSEFNIIVNDTRTMHIKENLSNVPFVEYIREAVFGYDIAKDEIIVSNAGYKYSYVYSFKSKNWHKITEVFEGFDRHLGMVHYMTPGTYAIGSVTVEPYGVKLPEGTKLVLTVGEDKYEYSPSKGVDSGTVVYMLETWLNEMGYRTIHTKTTEFIIAKKPGTEGNKVNLSITFDGPLNMSVNAFYGGSDPVEVKGICDIRSEEKVDELPVLIQTRPVSLGSAGFKKICHAALRGEMRPVDNRFFMCGIFASNDLTSWKCVTGSQNAKPAASAVLFRAAQSYRYFVIVCAGKVCSNHSIAFMEIEEENVLDNRLR